MATVDEVIYGLGLQKLAEYEAAIDSVSLSPEEVASEIEKIASIEDLEDTEEAVNEKIAYAVCKAIDDGDDNKAIALLGYLR